jgi:hypothetical protein
MKAEHDPEAKGLYVDLYEHWRAVERTVQLDAEGIMVNVDIDKWGIPIGVEVLYPDDSRQLLEMLKKLLQAQFQADRSLDKVRGQARVLLNTLEGR